MLGVLLVVPNMVAATEEKFQPNWKVIAVDGNDYRVNSQGEILIHIMVGEQSRVIILPDYF